MADSSSDIEAMDVQEADSILSMKENGLLSETVSSTDTTSKAISDVNENSVTDNSNHAIDLISDDEGSKLSNSTEDKTVDTEKKPEPESIIPKIDEEVSDMETIPAISDPLKDQILNMDEDKTESDAPTDATSPASKGDSEKTSHKEDEEKCTKSDSPEKKLDENSPNCSAEVIVADKVPAESNSQATGVDDSCPAPSKGEAENEPSENNSKVANEDTAKITSSKDESEVPPKSKSESKSESKKEKKKNKTCPECGVKKKLHFRIVFQGKSHQMCSEACYKNFKQKMTVTRAPSPKPEVITIENCNKCSTPISSGQGYYPLLGEIKPLCSEECLQKYHDINGPKKTCSQCQRKIESVYNQLIWETMNFCNEECLGQYQSFLGSHCTCCQTPVQPTSLGKYCVCFGADIRQFCSGTCLEDFKKNLKVCSYCQTDLSGGSEGFLAPVGEKGQFKDFCSQKCMERYEVMNNLTKSVPEVLECSHCKKQGNFKTHVKHQNKTHSLCCDLCVAGFRCTNRLTDNMCNTCYIFFKPKVNESFSFPFEGSPRYFCTKACMTLYVLSHRRIIQCNHCKVKKYTFDMIERIDPSNQTLMFCSLNCLSIHRSVGGSSSKSVRCDHCSKNSPAQYHLTMSDASLRNFCSYQCALNYQNKFTLVPPLTTTSSTRQTITPKTVTKTTTTGTSPVIVSAISLANHTRPPIITTAGTKGLGAPALVTMRQQTPSNLSILSPKPPISGAMSAPVMPMPTTSTGTSPLMREIVVRPPLPKSVKNKSASCRPIMQTKGVNAKLQTCHKAVQTDERPIPIILPIPVPIYVPTPLHMFSRPIGCPVPFPVPVPVPIIVDKSKDKQENTQNLFKLGSDKASGSQGFKPSEEATCSSNDKGENLNKRKCFDEDQQTQSKKPKYDLTPYSFGPDAWSQWTEVKNQEKELSRKLKYFKKDLLYLSAEDLNQSLGVLVQDFKRCEGHGYTASTLFYLCLSIQLYLSENGRMDNIFTDKLYESFINSFHDFLSMCEMKSSLNPEKPLRRISEDCLWSARQLGAHSPQILLNTLIYFNIKYFKLNTDLDHSNLHFNDITRRVRKSFTRDGELESYLVFFNPYCTGKKSIEDMMEQRENVSNALRCPVKLYEFYLSKCPSIPKENNNRFYLAPEKNCMPDGTWYSLKPLSPKIIKKVLQRYQYIDELNKKQTDI